MTRNASADLAATLSGDREAPKWIYSLHRQQTGTSLVFSESVSHPEVPPVLRLANMHEGEVVSEVWLYPEDLPLLVAELQHQLTFYRQRPGEERTEQLDLYKQPPNPRRRPEPAVRQYYGEFPR